MDLHSGFDEYIIFNISTVLIVLHKNIYYKMIWSKIKCFEIQYNIKIDQHSKNKATYNSEKDLKKQKTNMKKLLKNITPQTWTILKSKRTQQSDLGI